jgi:hypothetical protein
MTTTKTAETEAPATKTVAEQVSELAEKAVILPLGASLVVRVLRKLSKKYGTSAGLEKELTRYEKRGARARKGFEKQVRAQRTRIERGVTARRKDFEKRSSAATARASEVFSQHTV